ncbi:MAG: hypothetical protein Q8T11_16180 [Elusimicrobiota bacterium]|nr:hypothetical protein [Elusimicrobiota bacterium]
MINVLFAALLLNGSLLARSAAPVEGGPVAAPSVTVLKDRFIEAVNGAERTRILDQIARTPPRSGQDVAHLFDLFSRFTDTYTRDSVMASLARLEPGNPQLEPLFMTYLRQPEPEAQLFGVNGAFRLRSRVALPMIRDIAARKFGASSVTENNMMTERNSWWTQYEALSVLAQWEPEKSYPLLEKKGQESAKVGALLGRYYWKKTLPKLKGWSQSGGLIDSERASLAAAAPIDLAEARDTRELMLRLLRDPKLDQEIRRLLALKIGVSSTDEEAEALVAEHDTVKDESERLYWVTAAFSSRSPKVIPLLVRYARQAADPLMRKGATAQLIDMVGDAEARKLIDAK